MDAGDMDRARASVPQIVVDECTGGASGASPAEAGGSEVVHIVVHRPTGGGTLGMWFAPDGDHANVCKITAIQPHSPASVSDLRLNDVVTHIDTTPIYSARQAARVLQLAAAHVTFTVQRTRQGNACGGVPMPPSRSDLSRHAHATKYIDPHAHANGMAV